MKKIFNKIINIKLSLELYIIQNPEEVKFAIEFSDIFHTFLSSLNL